MSFTQALFYKIKVWYIFRKMNPELICLIIRNKGKFKKMTQFEGSYTKEDIQKKLIKVSLLKECLEKELRRYESLEKIWNPQRSKLLSKVISGKKRKKFRNCLNTILRKNKLYTIIYLLRQKVRRWIMENEK